jgi:hypothetical protein
MADTETPSDETPPAAPPRRAILGKIGLAAALVPYLATGFLALYQPG